LIKKGDNTDIQEAIMKQINNLIMNRIPRIATTFWLVAE